MWRSLWRSIDRFSLQYFKYISSELQGIKVVNNSNRDVVIDILQSIVEIVAYGDRHDASIFECFMENQVLAEFVRLLKISRTSGIEGPLLQYLSIMIQNLQSEQAIYYCFSNEYINSIITHQYEFDGGDLAPYYVSFLRAVSGKLTRDTLCLLVNVQEGTGTSFPLYSEALKFAHHGEKMIQTAIRSVILNIYNVSDDIVYQYVTNPPVSEYFSDLVLSLREQCLQLDAIVHAMDDHHANDKQKELVLIVEKLLDDLYYIKDLLCVGESRLSALVIQKLLGLLIVPIMIPFMQSNQNAGIQMSPVTSMYIITRVLQVVDVVEVGKSMASLVLYPYVTSEFGGLLKSDPSDGNSQSDCLSNEVNTIRGIVNSSLDCEGSDRNQLRPSFGSNSSVHNLSSMNLDYIDQERKGIITNIFSENQVLFLATLMVLLVLAENKDLNALLFSVVGFQPTKDKSTDASSAKLLEENILMKCLPQIFNELLKILGSTSTSRVIIQWYAGWFLQKYVVLQRGTLGRHKSQIFNLTVQLNASFHQSRERLVNELSGCWFDYIPDAFIKEWSSCKKVMEESSQRKDPFFILELAFHRISSNGRISSNLREKYFRLTHGNVGLHFEFEKLIPIRPNILSSETATTCHIQLQASVCNGGNADTWQTMVDAVKVFVLHLQLKAYIIQGHPPEDLPISWGKNSISSPRKIHASDASSASFGSEVPLGSGVPCKIAFSKVGVRDIYMIPVAMGASGNLLLVEKHPFHSRRGTVLAMAPLAGLCPKIEDGRPTWLHLRVREFNPYHMDQKTHPNGSNGEIDGRWTLGFPDAEACEAARLLISEETCKQRSSVENLLATFLSEDYARNVSQ